MEFKVHDPEDEETVRECTGTDRRKALQCCTGGKRNRAWTDPQVWVCVSGKGMSDRVGNIS